MTNENTYDIYDQNNSVKDGFIQKDIQIDLSSIRAIKIIELAS